MGISFMGFEIDQIFTLVANKDQKALDEIKQLSSLDIFYNNQTLFDCAIANNNEEVISFLAKEKKCHAIIAPISPEFTSGIKYHYSEIGIQKSLDETENELSKPIISWQRTPLLQACRNSNRFAIKQLLQNGAKTGSKDLLGLNEVDLCYESGGKELLLFFIEECKQSGQKVKVNEHIIERTITSKPELIDIVQEKGKLSVGSARLLFNFYCALLDIDKVKQMLSGGLNINKLINGEYHPVFQACTSSLLWQQQHPEFEVKAYLYSKIYGHPNTGFIHIDNSIIEEVDKLRNVEDIFNLLKSAEEENEKKNESLNAVQLSIEEIAEQTSKRIELLNILQNAGLDIELAEKKQCNYFVEDIVKLGQEQILQKLVEMGFSLSDYDRYCLESDQIMLLNKYKKDNCSSQKTREFIYLEETDDNFWELPYETTLLAETFPATPTQEKETTIRVTLKNLYGPMDGLTLSIRKGDPKSPTHFEDLSDTPDWKPLVLKEELLDIDGDIIHRKDFKDDIFEETCWIATFEGSLNFHTGSQLIEIKIRSDYEEFSMVLSDWEITI